MTLVDEGVGTQNYMAPECESGAGAPITSAADLYSAGKLLWSAVTGWFAFAREAPAFQAKSMNTIFPDAPRLWHLQQAFLYTIRQDPANRWKTAQSALRATARIEELVAAGYPPLRQLYQKMCPICGVGTLRDFDGSHMVFGNPGLRGIAKLQCTVCGYCFPVNLSRLQESIKEMESAN